jgi:glutamate racemase
MNNLQPIGIFDSGYGGLTVLKELEKVLPEYDYVYLGDNARAPYGTRSFETVYHYTLECVLQLFDMNCRLVILACNTASAKALRTIQQKDLPAIDPSRRVLGVIRPTTEIIGELTRTNQVGIFATSGTVASRSYPIEINKFSPDIKVFQEACPMWVPLVENNEFNSEGADYFIQKNIHHLLAQGISIDTIILGCTHYPLLINKLKHFLPDHVRLISQGPIVAKSLKDYLSRHPEMEKQCSKSGERIFYTTDAATGIFDRQAEIFYGHLIKSRQLLMEPH